MVRYTLFFAVALGMAILAHNISGGADAMAKCQEKHSYDTCFQILNR